MSATVNHARENARITSAGGTGAARTDGEVIDGSSAVDTSRLTGEPVPVEVGPGAAVVGASTSPGGRLVVRATAVGAQTQLARIAAPVESAQTGEAAVQRLADRVSGVFVPIVLAIALDTLIIWLVIGAGPAAASTATVTVLIIACPCALGLATIRTVTALMVGTGRGAQLGVLLKDPEVLESTRAVDTVVLDEAGTVTTGTMRLVVRASLLEESGWEVPGELRDAIATGGNQRAARSVAEQVGIDAQDVIAEVLPADKVDHVRRLQDGGAVVAMVGDGVNGAAALGPADLAWRWAPAPTWSSRRPTSRWSVVTNSLRLRRFASVVRS